MAVGFLVWANLRRAATAAARLARPVATARSAMAVFLAARVDRLAGVLSFFFPDRALDCSLRRSAIISSASKKWICEYIQGQDRVSEDDRRGILR